MASYISFKTSRVETGFSDFILDVLFFFFLQFFFSPLGCSMFLGCSVLFGFDFWRESLFYFCEFPSF